MGKCHIISGDGPPVDLPQFAGQHYQDNLNGVPYLSVSTAGVLSWQAQVDSGAITTSIATLQAQVDDLEDDVAVNETDIEDIELDQAAQDALIAGGATALTAHITDVANPHDTTLLNLDDVSSTAYTSNSFYILRANAAGNGVELYQSYEQTAVRTDPLLHQATTFQPYLVMTATVPVTGDYVFFMTHRFSLNATNVNFESHLEIGGDFFLINHVEPQDSFGAGIDVNDTDGGTTNTGTDNFQTRTAFKKFIGLTAGTHTFTLEFRGQTANQEATIYEAEMYLKRLAE